MTNGKWVTASLAGGAIVTVAAAGLAFDLVDDLAQAAAQGVPRTARKAASDKTPVREPWTLPPDRGGVPPSGLPSSPPPALLAEALAKPRATASSRPRSGAPR